MSGSNMASMASRRKVAFIGDMPVYAKDRVGKWRRFLIRNVCCIPSFKDTLISVDQLWDLSKVDVVFNDTRCIVLPSYGGFHTAHNANAASRCSGKCSSGRCICI